MSDCALTRRNFLAGGAAGVGAAMLATVGGTPRLREVWAEDGAAEVPVDFSGKTLVKKPQYSFEYIPHDIDASLITKTVDCEVLVIGAGVSSMGATMYLADRGVDVQVVEKGPHEGVHRVCVAGNNSAYGRTFGNPVVDAKAFAEDFWRYGGHVQGNMAVISRYAKDSGMWIDFLAEKLAPEGWTLFPLGGTVDEGSIWMEYNTAFIFMDDQGRSLLTGESPNWVKKMAQIAERDGAKFNYNEPVVRLEREGFMEGRCTGAITKNALTGAYTRYRASKGVICCAGDYNNDKELVHRYARQLEKCLVSISEPNNTGDVHKAALWIGADMDEYGAGDIFGFQNVLCNEYLNPMPSEPGFSLAHHSVEGCLWIPAFSSMPLLWVDNAGQRFMNEGSNSAIQSSAHNVLANAGGTAWTVWDSKTLDNLGEDWATKILTGSTLNFTLNTWEEVEREVGLGLIKKFDTIEELIDGCGFDPDCFRATLERYNEMCADGEDEDCFKLADFMVPVKDGPFYAAQWGCMVTSTRCGLKTDERARVLDTDGVPIPGLYAAGNNGGRFYGSSYPGTMGGTGIGHGQFFAFTAARDCIGEDVIHTKERIDAAKAVQPDFEMLAAIAAAAGIDPAALSFTPQGQ